MGRSSSSSRKFYYFVAVVGFLGLTMFGVQVLHENELRRRLPQGQTLMRSFASSSSSDASKGVSTSGGKNDGGKTTSASASPENQSQDNAAATCPFAGRRRLPEGRSSGIRRLRRYGPVYADNASNSSSSSDASKGGNTSGGKNDGGKTPSASASPENQSQDKAAQTCPFSGRRRLPEGLTAVFARQASRSSSSNASKGENTSGGTNDGGKTQSASASPENQSQDASATCPFSGRRRLPEGLTAVFARKASRSSSSN